MTIEAGRVPLLDENGRFPDRFTPLKAITSRDEAVDARNQARIARDQAEAFTATSELLQDKAVRMLTSSPSLALINPSMAARGERPVPVTSFDGVTYGGLNNNILASSDDGVTWSTVATLPGSGGGGRMAISALFPTDDGEVLAITTTTVFRSTGWGGSATWATVLTNPTPSYFYPWSVSGSGQKFIVTHYSGSGTQTPDRADSRYVWISLDGGRTWTIKWDTEAKFGAVTNELTHIHAAAYDPWEDRFFVAEGHVEVTGVYVSNNNGNSWTKLPYEEGMSPGNAPTVIIPTDNGVVFGSDASPNGMYVMRRGENVIRKSWVWNRVHDGALMGYAHMGFRDPRTGQVFMCWEINAGAVTGGETHAPVSVSDGRVSGEVGKVQGRLWRRIVVTPGGVVLAYEQTDDVIFRAETAASGVESPSLQDTGMVLGGKTYDAFQPFKALAVGNWAEARGRAALAIGSAFANGNDSVAIGNNASSLQSSVVIGADATADALAVAVGYQASAVNGTALGANAQARLATATALGRGSQAQTDAGAGNPNSTAVGRDAKANGAGGSGTAVGHAAVSGGSRSTAIGQASSASGNDSTALGQAAEATGNDTTALGKGSVADSIRSTAIGRSATANGAAGDGTAVGHTSAAGGARATAIGQSSTASGNDAIAIGQGSEASTVGAIAIGRNAKSEYTQTVALGAGTETSAPNQVAIGTRHIEIGLSTPSPASDATARLFVDVSEGKHRLMVRFPTGVAVEIAAEL